MNIFDLINAKEIATYYTEAATNNIPYLGATLFPAKKQLGLDLSWIKGSKGLPVALKAGVFDAKATIRDRVGVAKIETQMAFFRESMRIGEKDRQEILKAYAAANSDYIKPLITKIFDDVGNLVDGVDVDAERMRMQLLSTGKIDVSVSGAPYQYDYNMLSAHKTTLLTTAKWSDTTNSDPITNIITWQDKIEDDTGIRPTRAICTRTTWGYLLANAKIKLDMNTASGQNIIMTTSLMKQYLLEKLGLSVAVYSKKHALEVGGSSYSYFPDKVFTLIPEGTLGTTYFGTTPEEADLMTGKSRAKVQIVNTGVAVTTYQEEHPVNTVTVVSAICLPSFESMDNIFIATVA